MVTSRVLAGHPGDSSNIALPGMTRLVRVTSVTERGAELRLRGIVEDRSQLQPGESAEVEFVADRSKGELRTTLARGNASLKLV